ncbi:hypothetical protein OROMI_005271 [Orobanche minor]
MAHNDMKKFYYAFAFLLLLPLIHQSLSYSFPEFDISDVLYHAGDKVVTNGFLNRIKDESDRAAFQLGKKVGKGIVKVYCAYLNDHDCHYYDSPPPPPTTTRLSNMLKHDDDDGDSTDNYDSPPPLTVPAVDAYPTIDGLFVLKRYLYNFGYMAYSNPFTDVFDPETVSAVKAYQRFFGLDINGELDNQTFTQITTTPRCAAPDHLINSVDNIEFSWPKGKWFPNQTKLLTYAFVESNQLPDDVKKVFRDGFARWSSEIVTLNFTEATTFDAADIKIGFYEFGESLQDVGAAGGTLIVRDDDRRVVGDIRLDGGMYWVRLQPNNNSDNNGTWSWEMGDVELGTMAMHQIGHVLGLGHSSERESVMFPHFSPPLQKVQLRDDDRNSIQKLYSTSCGGCFLLFGYPTLFITTIIMSLGPLLFYY